MDHFLHPRGTGTLPDATGEGWSGSLEASRYMRIQVRVDANRIQAATFATYGCAPAIAAGSWLCEWATGRSVTEVLTLTSATLTDALGGLPESRRFCADLAIDALHQALNTLEALP